MIGTGFWMREPDDITPEDAAEYFDFVVIPLHHGQRGSINRRAEVVAWAHAFIAAGGTVWGMDWLPDASEDADYGYLDELASFIVGRLGGVGLMADTEPDAQPDGPRGNRGWRGAARRGSAQRYASDLKRVRSTHRLATAITDYGRGGMDRTTMQVLCEEADYIVPQSYDPDGSYDEDEHTRSIRWWVERVGSKPIVVVGLSLWLRNARRNRTVREFDLHLRDVPLDVAAICVWMGREGGVHDALATVLESVAAWRHQQMAANVPTTLPSPAEPSWDRSAIVSLAENAKDAGDLDAAVGLVELHDRLRGKAC